MMEFGRDGAFVEEVLRERSRTGQCKIYKNKGGSRVFSGRKRKKSGTGAGHWTFCKHFAECCRALLHMSTALEIVGPSYTFFNL